MAEQVFKSPGFFEKEVDLSQRSSEISGVPAGVAGTAEMGPAFVPVTVGSLADFNARFGNLSSELFGPYAVNEFLRNRTALTYVRVLGAGANRTEKQISNTETSGVVKAAGFIIKGTVNPAPIDPLLKRNMGTVTFITAIHSVPTDYEVAGYPIFTDNRTYGLSTGGDVQLIRGMLFTTSGSRIEVMNHDSFYTGGTSDDVATISSYDGSQSEGSFKLIVSSSQQGSAFANDEGFPGIKIYTASLDPSNINYVGKILNSDPDRFLEKQHLFYADMPVESELAKTKKDGGNPTVGLMSGSVNTDSIGARYIDLFGRFDTRYRAPRTTAFISQPYGATEYDLFHFETISDGEVANNKFKLSIAEIQRSSDPKNPYGSFTVQVRDFGDTDRNIRILERYPNCTLNPADENYVAKKIGDMKVFYNFDATTDSERRLVVEGKNPNVSRYVRIIMNAGFSEEGAIPKDVLPFGFRGLPSLKTNDTLTDGTLSGLPAGASALTETNTQRIYGKTTVASAILSASVVPPVPFRFKSTKGFVKASSSPSFAGEPGDSEVVDANLYWGVKFERLPSTGSMANAALNANASSTPNPLISSFSKMLGITKLDMLTTGSGADQFNDNKFTLARVALYNSLAAGVTLGTGIANELTGSAGEHILETAYLRDKDPDFANYTVLDGASNRFTMASLLAITSSVYFNKFTNFLKFTNMFYGGFDGNNILDKDMQTYE